jgi:hypothetical protein
VGVEHPEAPGRKDEEPDPREEYPDQPDDEVSFRSLEPRRHQVHQPRAAQHADDDEEAHSERQHRAYRAGELVGAPGILGVEGGVGGDERGGEGPFPEQVLQQVRDAERRGQGVGGVGGSEEMRGGP